MDRLAAFFNEEELIDIISSNSDIQYLETEEIEYMVNLLIQWGFKPEEVKQTILSNPCYLTVNHESILHLVKTLVHLGLRDVNSYLVNEPWLLNIDSQDLIEFIKEKESKGYDRESAFEMFLTNL